MNKGVTTYYESDMDSLPNELVDRVIDFLHDIPQALKACSLVCHIWSPAARFHLFHNIQVRTAEQMLDFQNPMLPFSCVEVLHIRPGLEHSPGVFDVPSWSRFSEITELRLTSLSSLIECDIQPFFSNFPLVEILSIKNAEFYTMFGLMQAIQSLPRLIDLSLEDVQWATLRRVNQEPSSSPWKLRNLRVKDVNFRELHQYFIQNDDFDLNSLEISLYYRSSVSNLSDLLHRCRKTLQKLNLRHNAWPLLTSLDIQQLKDLHEIELPLLKQGSSRHAWYPSLSLLATLDSEHLSRIVVPLELDPWHPPETRLSWVHWDELDTLLVKPRFESLREFEVIVLSHTLVITPKLRDDFYSEILGLLPRLSAQKSLKVRTEDTLD